VVWCGVCVCVEGEACAQWCGVWGGEITG